MMPFYNYIFEVTSYRFIAYPLSNWITETLPKIFYAPGSLSLVAFSNFLI